MKIRLITTIYLLIVSFTLTHAQDSSSTKRLDDEYRIRPSLNLDFFGTGKTGLIAKNKRLQQVDYQFKELSFSFYAPLVSSTSKNIALHKTYRSNFTLLATGSYVKSDPQFSFYRTERTFVRLSAGLRALYFDGNKSLWMINVSPFLAEDNVSIKAPKVRLFGDIVYSRVVSKMFSYRLGASYTFRFGQGELLPVIGVRIGDYNKHFLSLQFPRNISYNVKLHPKLYLGAFFRPNGGIYRFNLKTPDYRIFRTDVENKSTIMTRTDLLSGLMLNYAVSPSFYLSCNAGFVYNRSVDLSRTENFNGKGGGSVFKGSGKTLNIENSGFVNFSLTFYFGKPSYVSGFAPLLEMKAVNSTHDAGDLNNSNDAITNDMNQVSENDINKKEARSSLEDNYKDVQDYLMEE